MSINAARRLRNLEGFPDCLSLDGDQGQTNYCDGNLIEFLESHGILPTICTDRPEHGCIYTGIGLAVWIKAGGEDFTVHESRSFDSLRDEFWSGIEQRALVTA